MVFFCIDVIMHSRHLCIAHPPPLDVPPHDKEDAGPDESVLDHEGEEEGGRLLQTGDSPSLDKFRPFLKRLSALTLTRGKNIRRVKFAILRGRLHVLGSAYESPYDLLILDGHTNSCTIRK